MGCDIHFFVEARQPNGSWKSADKWVDGDGYKHVPHVDRFYDVRNYSLFAILADVRNGVEFAGVPTGEGYRPICEPRGLPSNVSTEVKAEYDEWGVDGHSHSWLTLAELKAYDWDQETKRCGIVGVKEFSVFLGKGRPESWCGGVGGQNIKIVSNDEMKLIEEDDKNTYTKVWWPESYRDSVGSFLTDTLPKMEALGDPESVRAVFWFDN